MMNALSRKGLIVLFQGLISFGLIFVSSAVFASSGSSNTIGGKITEDTVLSLSNSPYRLTRSLEVPPDIKLTIEPGVEIVADLYTSIIVRGNLYAMGTKSKWIKITATKSDEPWDGIQLKNDSFDYESEELLEGHGVLIEFCKISGARTGILIEACNPIIRKNKIKNNEEGIMCRDYASPLIENNIFLNNSTGIECVNYSSPNIRHNTIVGKEGKGIRCENNSSPKIFYNTIFGKGETWWRGLTVVKSSQPIINFNNIYANGGINLAMVKLKAGDDSLAIDAKNNWWGMSDLESIARSIDDKSDKAFLGEVIFDPFSENKIANAKHTF